MLCLPFFFSGCLGVAVAGMDGCIGGGDAGGGEGGTILCRMVGFFSSRMLIFFTFFVRSLIGSSVFVLMVVAVLNDMFGSSSPKAMWPPASCGFRGRLPYVRTDCL